MTTPLKVSDIASYLPATGWEQDPHGWRGASIWRHPAGYEVLVPARDGMGDGDRRVREILRCLSAVEDRPEEDIALEIARPRLDRQHFRTFPAGRDAGYTSLLDGMRVLQGVRDLLRTAARTVLEGQHFAFAGQPTAGVGAILRAAELGPSRAGSYVIELRLPTDVAARAPGGAEVGGRAVLVQMQEAVRAAHTSVLADAPAEFDEMVMAGVSADLCRALSNLSGSGQGEPFEIIFRWGRAQPRDVLSHAVMFPEKSGSLLREVAGRLRHLNASGPATVTGVIEGLHDDAAGGDRWRIKVRGELSTERAERSRRAVWVRLGDEAAYDRAVTVHRQQREITVAGELSSATGRVELVPVRKLGF